MVTITQWSVAVILTLARPSGRLCNGARLVHDPSKNWCNEDDAELWHSLDKCLILPCEASGCSSQENASYSLENCGDCPLSERPG